MDTDKLKEKIENLLNASPTLDRSMYQIDNFILGPQAATSGRLRRSITLELRDRYMALQKAEIGRKRTEAEIRICKRKLELQKDTDKRVLIECDIDDKYLELNSSTKLIKDAIDQANLLLARLEATPQVSDSEFESQESEYWKNKLVTQARLQVLAHNTIDPATAEALIQIGIDPVLTQLKLFEMNQKVLLENKND